MDEASLKQKGPVWPNLTARERQILYPVLEGKPNKLIASELGISMRTVESHRAKLFYKMGVRNAVQLACTLYAEHGQGLDRSDQSEASDKSATAVDAYRQTGAGLASSSATGSRSG